MLGILNLRLGLRSSWFWLKFCSAKIDIYIYMYVCMYVYMCVCVCVCVCVFEKESGRRRRRRITISETIWNLICGCCSSSRFPNNGPSLLLWPVMSLQTLCCNDLLNMFQCFGVSLDSCLWICSLLYVLIG